MLIQIAYTGTVRVKLVKRQC